MGGLKRKIPIQKRETQQQRSVAFSKRRHGLYKKAAELCVRFDAQIAVIASGPSHKNRDCFYSFGHSSVDNVVDAFLQNRPLVKASADNSIVAVDETLERRSSSTMPLLEHVLSDGFGYGENLEELTVSLDIIRGLKDELARKIHGGGTNYDDPNPPNSFANSDGVDQMNAAAIVNFDSSKMENSPVGNSLPSQLGFTRDEFNEPPAPPTASSEQFLTNSDEDFIFCPESSYGNGGSTSYLLCANANPNPENNFGNCDDVDQMNATAVINSDYSGKDDSPQDDSLWSQLEFILDDCELIFCPDQGIDQYGSTDALVVMDSGHHLYPNPHLNPNADPGANLSSAQLMVEDDVFFDEATSPNVFLT